MPEIYVAHPDYGYDRDFRYHVSLTRTIPSVADQTRGYGEAGLPSLKWPNNAKIAVNFVINYEEVCESKE